MRRNRHMSAASGAIDASRKQPEVRKHAERAFVDDREHRVEKYQTEMYHATRGLPPSPAETSSKDAVGAFKDAALAVVTRVVRRTMPNDASPETTLGRKFAFRERRSRWPRRGSRPQRRSRASSDSRRAPGRPPERARCAEPHRRHRARCARRKVAFSSQQRLEIFFSVDETFVTATPDRDTTHHGDASRPRHDGGQQRRAPSAQDQDRRLDPRQEGAGDVPQGGGDQGAKLEKISRKDGPPRHQAAGPSARRIVHDDRGLHHAHGERFQRPGSGDGAFAQVDASRCPFTRPVRLSFQNVSTARAH